MLGRVMCAVLAAGLMQTAAAVTVGAPAPDFAAVDSNGVTHRLSDFRGKRVVLEWTNHGCPFVQRHYNSGNMQALQEEMTDDGHVWLSVISSAPGTQGHVSPEKANALTDSRDAAPTAVLLDASGEVGRAYEAATTPHMYVIDGDGTLVYKGAIDDSPYGRGEPKNYVRMAVNSLTQGQPVDPASTRPYGCSVKYAN